MARNRLKSVWKASALVAIGVLLAGVAVTARSGAADTATAIVGDYAEARTCDVWTGPCFANGEMNLTGDKAVVAWSIDEGSWKGVRLDGLRIAASLDAEGTFGTDVVGKVRAVVFVDRKASARQESALLDFARTLAPDLLKDVVKVKRETIEFARSGSRASLRVGESREVELVTTALMSHCDSVCGNEAQFYPALAPVNDVVCAKTVTHAYRGKDLGSRWSSPHARSALVGRFSAQGGDAALARTGADD